LLKASKEISEKFQFITGIRFLTRSKNNWRMNPNRDPQPQALGKSDSPLANGGADLGMRVGEYRVFYDVSLTESIVYVRAVRKKPRGTKTEDIL
jgi:mRNA-degrading endonuclease RelE of RelBE toxin-antitoxin system